MAETCLALLVISLFTSLFLSIQKMRDPSGYRFCDRYLSRQAEALSTAEDREIEESGRVIGFNENGNVRQAQTLDLGSIHRRVIIELGGGRLVTEP